MRCQLIKLAEALDEPQFFNLLNGNFGRVQFRIVNVQVSCY
jgi:hypothetical protein